ncbi:putative ankyrin repeat protein RF_0381 [Haliotis asinina]|uniref:putative ankyrin repeat protein RF_0381 n=1 Tax=Haliotis asinina TaxID=109174 RepID=UPI0035320B80
MNKSAIPRKVKRTLIDACSDGDLHRVKHFLSQDFVNINERGEGGRTLAMMAAEKGHREILELLLEEGADVSLLDDDDDNILHVACRNGKVDIVKYIHSHNILDFESRGENMRTPILTAAEFGKTDVFFFLIEIGANVSKCDENSDNILHLSCQGGSQEIVHYILKQNIVDINAEGYGGRTALVQAALYGWGKIFQLLIQSGADVGQKHDHMKLFECACEGGDGEVVKYILNLTTVDINSYVWGELTPVMQVAKTGESEVFKVLVSKGADMTKLSKEKENILHLSCHGGNVDIVKYILEQNIVDINSKRSDGKTPLMLASLHGCRNIFQLLIGKDADVGTAHDCEMLFTCACEGGDAEIVTFVLNHTSVDVNSILSNGITPLMCAAKLGHEDLFKLLVTKGADMAKVDDDHENVLHIACRDGNTEILKYILKQNVLDINSKQEDGMTPLLLAAALAEKEVVEILVAKGADPTAIDDDGDGILHLAVLLPISDISCLKYILTQNIVDINGRGRLGMTPLLLAAESGNRDVFDILIEGGADVSAVNDNGDDVLHVACREGNEVIVKYVLSHCIKDITIKNNQGLNATEIAREKGYLSITKLLSQESK